MRMVGDIAASCIRLIFSYPILANKRQMCQALLNRCSLPVSRPDRRGLASGAVMFTRALLLVHEPVRFGQQPLGVAAIGREVRDPDAGRKRLVEMLNPDPGDHVPEFLN